MAKSYIVNGTRHYTLCIYYIISALRYTHLWPNRWSIFQYINIIIHKRPTHTHIHTWIQQTIPFRLIPPTLPFEYDKIGGINIISLLYLYIYICDDCVYISLLKSLAAGGCARDGMRDLRRSSLTHYIPTTLYCCYDELNGLCAFSIRPVSLTVDIQNEKIIEYSIAWLYC